VIVLVCGSRYWTNRDLVKEWLYKLQYLGFDTIVEGEAPGADTIAREEGEELGFIIMKSTPEVKGFPANWKKFGRSAGPIRNKQMLDEGNPVLVLAFHENIGKSKGTKNMIKQAIARNINCTLVSLDKIYYHTRKEEK